jgi:Transposase and inactivated derivatives, IS5 family
MKLEKSGNMTFFESYMGQIKTRRSEFFKKVNSIIDWRWLERELDKVYKKGQSVDGRPSYPSIVLFKMLLIEMWYDMSDVECEDFVKDSVSARIFLDLELNQPIPDHSTISRFRSELVRKKAYDRLLRKINKQLEYQGAKVKKGKTIVDASVTISPYAPKGKTTYEIAEDRNEDESTDENSDLQDTSYKLIEKTQPGVDTDARWLKKSNKLMYGYKQSVAVDEKGMIDAVCTSSANVNDGKLLSVLLSFLPSSRKKEILADKGYKIPQNDELLKMGNIKNRIMFKSYRNRSLTHWQQVFNKIISRYRYVVERTFGSIKRWFNGGVARYKGLAKVHAQHVLQAIAYNLKRAVSLI